MDLTKQYVIINGIRFPVNINLLGNTIELQSKYNPTWLKIIKTEFEAPHWCGADKNPRKDVWTIKFSRRNIFRLAFHQGLNPYRRYDLPLQTWDSKFPLLKNQFESATHMFTRRFSILAGEMGTGKTLAMLDVVRRVVEDLKIVDTWSNIWYVGPKGGVRSVTREIAKWKFPYRIQMFTYQKLVNELKEWQGQKAPIVLILDEAHFLKNPTSQRSTTCAHITRSMVMENKDCWIMAMSGTPAPKNPADWWHLCEVVCPGFLAEGHRQKLVDRLALVEEATSDIGARYPKLITWFDNEQKCKTCGQFASDMGHSVTTFDSITMEPMPNPGYHSFVASKNEVAYLHERMKGLVLVQFKKDCVDLPEKTYEVIKCKPTVDALRTMRSIRATTSRTVTVLMRLRELSDGFQYTEQQTGETTCSVCNGLKKIEQYTSDGSSKELMDCDGCNGTGKVPVYERASINTACPKDDVLLDLLEEIEEIGRVVIWAAFTSSIDKIIDLVTKRGWYVIRYDQQVKVELPNIPIGPYPTVERLLDGMDASHPERQSLEIQYPKIAFVGQPMAGGVGLTLTAAPMAIYYSNHFAAEARIQSEDRIHRVGMDQNRACRIVDIVNLPTDELVIQNLRKKRDLQAMTMMELEEFLNEHRDVDR